MPPCATGTVWPAIVRAELRVLAEAAFDAMLTPIVALPEPDVGDRLAHVGSPLDAVHAQFEPLAVSCTLPVVPFGP